MSEGGVEFIESLMLETEKVKRLIILYNAHANDVRGQLLKYSSKLELGLENNYFPEDIISSAQYTILALHDMANNISDSLNYLGLELKNLGVN